MGQKARKEEIAKILSWLRLQVDDQIRSKTGRLIHALQARAIFDARQIAAELAQDLELIGTSEARCTLSEVSELLLSDAVFNQCDRLSVLLLDLEQKFTVTHLPVLQLCLS